MKKLVLSVLIVPLLPFVPLVLALPLLVAACTGSIGGAAVGSHRRGRLHLVYVRPEISIG